jgi:hypothetical protein
MLGKTVRVRISVGVNNYLAKPRSAPRPGVVDVLLEEGEGQFTLGRLVFCGGSVDVDVHDVLGKGHVTLLVVLVLHDEDGVEPNREREFD